MSFPVLAKLSSEKLSQFTDHRKDSDWETLAQRRTIARLCAHCEEFSAERAWRAMLDRLRVPYYMRRADHVMKIRDRKQRTDIGKYSFVNRTIINWTQLPAEELGAFLCKPSIFRKRIGKAIILGVKRKE